MITPESLAASGSEHGQQAALYCWRAMNIKQYPQLKWLHAIPNGFFGSASQKSKMKAEGLTSGIWDNFLPVPKMHVHGPFEDPAWCGLYIEMKIEKYRNAKNGGLTDEQLAFREACGEHYKFVVCYGWEDARDRILEYLNG